MYALPALLLLALLHLRGLAARPTRASAASPRADAAVYQGQGTFFDPGQGACGSWAGRNDYIVALNQDQYGNVDAYSPDCYRMVHITNVANGRSANAIVQDACPTCPYGALDLSPSLFGALAESFDQGIIPLMWFYTDSTKDEQPSQPPPPPQPSQSQSQEQPHSPPSPSPASTPASSTSATPTPSPTYGPPIVTQAGGGVPTALPTSSVPGISNVSAPHAKAYSTTPTPAPSSVHGSRKSESGAIPPGPRHTLHTGLGAHPA
ncbi:hypothetical protein BOTBODRAFT_49904 [Botryobasidium botryosum FD-172 SS1]|uniref:RlpA-like protein double-psi beta-barrel domain-containing protein n=1 Tax=Botryobasidium botryosum (strain FD-172 SS1) TaxID=930990 RepID=A0A067MZQ5_BOTB1|nr:hypothetical protein BOTBODRAFT_49904 [Botryobasidium botryosum FD-172 SS1]